MNFPVLALDTVSPRTPTDTSLVAPSYETDKVRLYVDDCVRVLRTLEAGSVDAVVTDPPYAIAAPRGIREAHRGIGGSRCSRCENSSKDGYRLCEACLKFAELDALRSAPMLGMQSQNWHERATHSRGYADNDNRLFETWCGLWLHECFRVLKPGGHIIAFGGTKTWHRLACATEDAGFEIRDSIAWLFGTGVPKSLNVSKALRAQPRVGVETLEDASDRDRLAEQWDGWGTNLKPGHEPIIFARKPLAGTVITNVETYGTGAIHIDDSRVPHQTGTATQSTHPLGRWPTNVLLDLSQADELDSTSDNASKFFWVAKPSQTERVTVGNVSHPTVKPVTLMRYLVNLVTTQNSLVVDPFAGSGTTVEACLIENRNVIGVEKDPRYFDLIVSRVHRQETSDGLRTVLGGSDGQSLF